MYLISGINPSILGEMLTTHKEKVYYSHYNLPDEFLRGLKLSYQHIQKIAYMSTSIGLNELIFFRKKRPKMCSKICLKLLLSNKDCAQKILKYAQKILKYAQKY